MIDHEHERLLQEYVGGTASAREIAQVEAWLATSAEGRERRQQLETLFLALAGVPRETPPDSLRDGVLREIRQRREGHAPAPAASMRRWALLAPAAVVAVALAVTAPFWWRGLRPEGDSSVSGSLVAGPRDHGVVDLGDVRVKTSASWVPEGMAIQFDVVAASPVRLVLSAPDDRLAHVQVRDLDPARVQSYAEQHRLAIRLDSGARFQLIVDSVKTPGEPARLIVESEGRRTEGAVPLPRNIR
jgi:hypothetical protein